MRIEQLEYVAAVTEHGSLRRASEALHISQPALSEAVTKLERELGLTLIDRRRSGSRISRQGLDLLQHMSEVLESVDRLRQAAGDQAVRVRELRIGTVDKFQGQEAAVAIYSLATSSSADAPRGMEFLYSLNRLNVATSRGKCVSVLVASPGALQFQCRSPRQMQLALKLLF